MQDPDQIQILSRYLPSPGNYKNLVPDTVEIDSYKFSRTGIGITYVGYIFSLQLQSFPEELLAL